MKDAALGDAARVDLSETSIASGDPYPLAKTNPLERLTPEEVRGAYEFYVGQYQDLRLTICQNLAAQALADGLPPRDDLLDWGFMTSDELRHALSDANGFLFDADKLEIGFTLDWLECVMTLKGQLEDAFLMFISASRESNS